MAFSPDGKELVSAAGDKTLRIWEVSTGKQVHELNAGDGSIIGVAISPDGKRILTISGDGTSYAVTYPGSSSTSVYGVNSLGGNEVQLVGSYVNSGSSTRNGFYFQGTYGNGTVTGTYTTIDAPGSTFNYIHSTMGGLAVGNYDGPTASGIPIGPGHAFIYNVETDQTVANVRFPGSISDTGIACKALKYFGWVRYSLATLKLLRRSIFSLASRYCSATDSILCAARSLALAFSSAGSLPSTAPARIFFPLARAC